MHRPLWKTIKILSVEFVVWLVLFITKGESSYLKNECLIFRGKKAKISFPKTSTFCLILRFSQLVLTFWVNLFWATRKFFAILKQEFNVSTWRLQNLFSEFIWSPFKEFNVLQSYLRKLRWEVFPWFKKDQTLECTVWYSHKKVPCYSWTTFMLKKPQRNVHANLRTLLFIFQ